MVPFPQPGGDFFVAFVHEQLLGQRLARVIFTDFTLWGAGEEGFGFNLYKAGGDDEKSGDFVGGSVFQFGEIRKELVGDLREGEFCDVEFGAFDELEQQIERTLVNGGGDPIGAGLVGGGFDGHAGIIPVFDSGHLSSHFEYACRLILKGFSGVL